MEDDGDNNGSSETQSSKEGGPAVVPRESYAKKLGLLKGLLVLLITDKTFRVRTVPATAVALIEGREQLQWLSH